eukprot:2846938-Amphidinium_carterae.1
MRADAAERRAGVAEQAVSHLAARPSERPLVDTRALGRPRGFKSVRGEWPDWSFQFRAFLAGANAQALDLLDAAAARDQTWRLAAS